MIATPSWSVQHSTALSQPFANISLTSHFTSRHAIPYANTISRASEHAIPTSRSHPSTRQCISPNNRTPIPSPIPDSLPSACKTHIPGPGKKSPREPLLPKPTTQISYSRENSWRTRAGYQSPDLSGRGRSAKVRLQLTALSLARALASDTSAVIPDGAQLARPRKTRRMSPATRIFCRPRVAPLIQPPSFTAVPAPTWAYRVVCFERNRCRRCVESCAAAASHDLARVIEWLRRLAD